MELLTDYIQKMDSASLAFFSGIIGVIFICGILAAAKFESSKNVSSTKRSKTKNERKELSVTQHDYRRAAGSNSVTQNQLRSGKKQKSLKTQKTVSHSRNTDHINLSESAVKNWLQNDTYCYNGNLTSSSCIEDNLITGYVMDQGDNSACTTDRSEILNSSSSTEDLPLTSLENSTKNTKEMLQRHTKNPKRKNRSKHKSNVIEPKTDVEYELKENMKTNASSFSASKKDLSLRKQCTKAAALKTALKNSQISRALKQDHIGLESHLCTKNSLSSSSSSITSNISSESSSPAQSVNSSPTASPTTNKRFTENFKRRSLISPLRQYIKLNMNEQELVQQMKRYVIEPSLLRIYGFPVESIHYEGCVDIYKCLPKHLAEEAVTKDNQRHHVNFYGRRRSEVINESDGLNPNYSVQNSYSSSLTDSGHVSGESSPRFTDSDSSEMCEEESIAPLMAFFTPDGVYQVFSDYCNTKEKQCVRCLKIFEVNENGEYLSFDSCSYHWGKLSNVYDGKCYINTYSCCQGDELSEGCSQHHLHVWNGVVVGLNGPYTGFVHTRNSNTSSQKKTKVYAIDCEMSYTGLGLEVTKVTVVGFDGSLVYEHFVKPQAEIIDYNTRFSGVSAKDFLPDSNSSTKTFTEVQTDLLNLFDSDTILVGHGLDNDLKALRLVHKTIVDTSVIFSHSTGYPYRRSLKNLTKSFLKRDIQCGDMGHSSFEDSRACLELMMWKIRKDLRHWSYP